MIKVLVVDDEPLVRSGVTMLLSGCDDVQVVGEAGDGAAAIQAVSDVGPTVVIMDLRMPGTDGPAAIRRLTADGFAPPDHPARVLALTTFDDEATVHEALRAGANGFLVKQNAPQYLLEAVRAVAAGRSWLDPSVAGHVIAALRDAPVAGTSRSLIALLTARECEVLTQLALGRSNADIAGQLWLSEATVRTHVSRILMKTGVGDRTRAVVLAYQSGLVKPNLTDRS